MINKEISRSQLEEISNLLLAYSAGEYHVKGKISANVDELDMIISGINMLGEELQATNVSRDFFLSIFNSVSDFVFIVNDDGKLIDVNKAVCDFFNFDSEAAINQTFSDFVSDSDSGIFKIIQNKLQSKQDIFRKEITLKSSGDKIIYGACTSTIIYDRFGKFNGYLVIIKDITEQKEKENLILRTIISTQQNEQKRVASDLHDAFGQELSMVRLMVANLIQHKQDDKHYLQIAKTCIEMLDNASKHLREICFDIMPSVLIKGGLTEGVKLLVNQLKVQNVIQVDFSYSKNFPRINPDVEIASYRIIQEFVNNMIKHAKAKKLVIKLLFTKPNEFTIQLIDDGIGFNINQRISDGREHRGLQNIHSKVKAYNGTCMLESSPGKGTQLIIQFPIIII